MRHLLDATYETEQRHFWFDGLSRFSEPLIARALAGRASPLILDCGFGTGANMAKLSRWGRVVGLDIVTHGVTYARRYRQTQLVQASVTEIPLASETFDLVTGFDVLACLDESDVSRAFEEVHRVLRPGGAFLFNTAALPVLRGSHAVFGQEVHRARRRPLRARLERHGFSVDRLTYTNFSLLPLMLAVRLSERTFGLSSPEESGVDIVVPSAWVNRTLAGILAAEAFALRFVDMPIGSSLLGLAYKTR